jgi:hypothetical protein
MNKFLLCFAAVGYDILIDVEPHNLQMLLKGFCSHCNVIGVGEISNGMEACLKILRKKIAFKKLIRKTILNLLYMLGFIIILV